MTDAPGLDEREHFTVIQALINDALGTDGTGVQRAWDYGTMPGDPTNPDAVERAKTPPNIFVLVGIERRYVVPAIAGRSPRSGWRVTFRYVGRTVAEARWAGAKVAAAMEARLTVAGVASTHPTHESSQAVAPDDGRYSGLAFYTYAL